MSGLRLTPRVDSHWLGTVAFFVSAIALALAVIPPEILKEPGDVIELSGTIRVAAAHGEALKVFRVVAMSTALCGLIAGLLGWIRQQERIVPNVAIGVATLALFWQYIVIAVMIALAVGIIFVILTNLG